MRTKILCMLCLFCAKNVFAQRNNTFAIYPRIGINLSSFTGGGGYSLDNEETFSYEPQYTIGFNLGGEIAAKKQNTGFSLGLIFNLEQITFKDVFASSETYGIRSENFSVSNKYLETPFLISYDIWENNNTKISLKSGVQFRFLLSGTTKSTIFFYKRENDHWSIDNNFSGKNKGNFTYGYNKIQMAIPIGFSYEYKKVSLDFRYNIGLTNLYKYSEEKIYSRSFVLSVGYRVAL